MRAAADKPDLLVSRHAPHAAALGQADKPDPTRQPPQQQDHLPPHTNLFRDQESIVEQTRARGHAHHMTLFPLAPRLRYHTRAVGCAARITTARSPSAIGALGVRL